MKNIRSIYSVMLLSLLANNDSAAPRAQPLATRQQGCGMALWAERETGMRTNARLFHAKIR